MEKDIVVNYIEGLESNNFIGLKELGVEADIVGNKPRVTAHLSDPNDYIIIFSIYFSLKLVDKIAENLAERLVEKFSKTIKDIWDGLKDTKPAIIKSNQEPEFKLPKAKLVFKISEEETSSLEITNELTESELEKLLKTQLKLVKMKYKHRRAEQKLINK
jgi:hypothetical protein